MDNAVISALKFQVAKEREERSGDAREGKK